MHNNPKHKAKKTIEFLYKKCHVVINWPSNSPDLNPIEKMWSLLKGNVEKTVQVQLLMTVLSKLLGLNRRTLALKRYFHF